MCDTCGCGQPGEAVTISKPGDKKESVSDDHHSHDHDHVHHVGHSHDHHDHDHDSPEARGRTIRVETDVLAANNLLAERNRGFFEAKGLFVLNMMSAPGSGKTTILERTISDLKDELNFSIIEGDQQSMNDAERISATNVPVVQINTGTGCHLDADMIKRSLNELELVDGGVVIIENVGNLVCPALFDLGEAHKVVIISVTEGEDKPIKYPHMFSVSDVCIINKTDLLPYVDYDISKAKDYALKVNHHLKFFEMSAKTGDGMDIWYDWLRNKN